MITLMKKGCPHCPRVFKTEGKNAMAMGRLAANLANHIKSAHPDHYKPSAGSLKRKAEQRFVATESGLLDRGQSLPRGHILISGPDVTTEPTKRIYQRKAQPQSSVCYCPKCGCNIRAVQVAMGLS
tara:strand:+ start:1126 stop:1503 length:378 start_codon:yes stop_codon:yes gene_type:complete